MIKMANPEAEAALWESHLSVSRFIMKFYEYLQPQVRDNLSQAASKIHISFDGWTTKGSKRSLFGIVAHYANTSGLIIDLPIALPQLSGHHMGERISEVVTKTLTKFGIDAVNLGYFVLDNASTNNTAVAALTIKYNFTASYHRLRCAPHIINLIGQAILFGLDYNSYDNVLEEASDKAKFLTK